MAQMEIVPFNNPSNVVLLDAIRGNLTPDYQARIPAATKAGLDATMNAMWNYSPAVNQFVDALINLIGAQIIKNMTWTNPLAKYKRGLLNRGETIEEVAVGLIKAKSYNADQEYLEHTLFGREPNNVQSVFHKINRAEFYKLTVTETMLERAFLNEGGLSKFINSLMESINTSDNWDEFLETTSTLKRYYNNDGFFKLQVPDITSSSATANDSKQFLKQVRMMSDTLPFISKKYNARHMERSSRKEDLELILTPAGQAAIDVDALSAAFNEDKASMNLRTTIIPPEYIGIPGFQGILTTKDFWIIADNIMRMGQTQNPAGMYNNYFWHHQETISASPFENAILLSSIESTPINVINYLVVSLNAYTLSDIVDGTSITVTTANGGDAASVKRGDAYVVVNTANTDPVGGPNNGVTLSLTGNGSRKTRINQQGVLVIGYDEPNTTIVIHGRATDDNTFERDLTLTVTGPLVQGSVGLNVDEDVSTIANRTLPKITVDGADLVVSNGTWDTKDLTITYAWYKDGTVITGATTNVYTPVTGDKTHSITATVTVNKTGYTQKSATSTAYVVPA